MEDLRRMYSLFQPGDDIVLWCDGRASNQETATCTKNKHQAESDKGKKNTDTVDVLACAAMKVIDHIKGNTSAQSDKSQSVSITTNVAVISSSPEDLHYGLSQQRRYK